MGTTAIGTFKGTKGDKGDKGDNVKGDKGDKGDAGTSGTLQDSGIRMHAQTVSIAFSGVGSQVVGFPAGVFSVAPFVLVTPQTSVPGSTVLGAGASGITTAGCTIYCNRTNATATVLHVLAIQLPSGGFLGTLTQLITQLTTALGNPVLVLGLNDVVPPTTPADTLIVRRAT